MGDIRAIMEEKERKEEETEEQSNSGEQPSHVITPAGPRFAPGNQAAKGRAAISLDKQAVLKAMQDAGTRHGKAFIDFVFDKAYSNNTVLCKVLDKLIADVSLGIKTADIIGNTIILQFTNYNPGAKEGLKEAETVKEAIFESVDNKGENGSLPPYGDKEGEGNKDG